MLVAIAIPIFTSQLEKSREATDAANIRSAYAEIMSAALTGEDMTDLSAYKVSLKQKKTGWQGAYDFPKNLGAGSTDPADGGEATFTWNSTNETLSVNLTLTQATGD